MYRPSTIAPEAEGKFSYLRQGFQISYAVLVIGIIAWMALPQGQAALSPELEIFLNQRVEAEMIADTTIKAPFEVSVTDTDAYEQKREEARRNAKPVYLRKDDYAQSVQRFVRQTFSNRRDELAELERRYRQNVNGYFSSWETFLENQDILARELQGSGEEEFLGPAPPADYGLERTEAAVQILPAVVDAENLQVPYVSSVNPVGEVEPISVRYERFLRDAPFTIPRSVYRRLEAQQFHPLIQQTVASLVQEVYTVGVVNKLESDLIRIKDKSGFVAIERESGERAEFSAVDGLQDVESANTIVREHLARRNDLSSEQSALVREMMSGIVQPDLDYSATESAQERNRQADEVLEPQIVYKAGQKIVGEGEKITAPMIAVFAQIREELGPEEPRGEASLFGVTLSVWSNYMGAFLLVALVLGNYFYFLQRFSRRFFRSFTPAAVMGLVLVINLFLVKVSGIAANAIAGQVGAGPFGAPGNYLYAFPFASGAMIVCMLLGNKLALHYTTGMALLTLLVTFDPVSTLLALVGSLAAISLLEAYVQRSSVYKAGMLVGVTNAIVAVAVNLYMGTTSTMDAVIQIVLGLLVGGMLPASVAIIFMPVVEWTFRLTSNFQLMELITTNHKLLKDLTVKAPGTYTHSMGVANLSEAACDAIGANSVLARVGSYFHDIGKMIRPQYFVENQMGEENPHNRLTPQESAEILRKHVTEGLALAKKYKLPPAIQDFIATHHGDDTMQYFYIQASNDAGENAHKVDENQFKYPGPKPFSKETAIVAMADSVEAATRALKNYTEESIRQRVQAVITSKINNGQLDNCELSFQELKVIYDTFVKFLVTSYHTRIEYPKMQEKKQAESKTVKAAVGDGTPRKDAPSLQVVSSLKTRPGKPKTRLSPKHPMAKIPEATRHIQGDGAPPEAAPSNGNESESKNEPDKRKITSKGSDTLALEPGFFERISRESDDDENQESGNREQLDSATSSSTRSPN